MSNTFKRIKKNTHCTYLIFCDLNIWRLPHVFAANIHGFDSALFVLVNQLKCGHLHLRIYSEKFGGVMLDIKSNSFIIKYYAKKRYERWPSKMISAYWCLSVFTILHLTFKHFCVRQIPLHLGRSLGNFSEKFYALDLLKLLQCFMKFKFVGGVLT